MFSIARGLTAAILSLLFFSQTSPVPPGQARPGSDTSKISTDAKTAAKALITVHGLCDQHPKQTNDCVTLVTRTQFDALISAVGSSDQPLPPNARQQLAKTYAESLAVEAAVHRAGMQETVEFREYMRWSVARSATEFYRRKLQEKYKTPSQAEIDDHYHQHVADYERVELIRVLVPRHDSQDPKSQAFDTKAREAASKARRDLLEGVDPVEVQKSAYQALGLAAPPHTDLGLRHRADMLAAEANDVFALKAGEVTAVEIEPESYVIYKVASRDTLPLEQVKSDIARAIFQQKFRDAMKAAIDAASLELDQQYLDSSQGSSARAPAN